MMVRFSELPSIEVGGLVRKNFGIAAVDASPEEPRGFLVLLSSSTSPDGSSKSLSQP